MMVATSDIDRITRDIWGAVLGLELQERLVGPEPLDGPMMTGLVHITGDWSGAVAVELTARLASQATAIMFGLQPDAVAADDVRDVVGELANMTGGNVKSLLGGSCSLSLPSVTEGERYAVRVPGARVADRVGFACAGEPLVVTVLERNV